MDDPYKTPHFGEGHDSQPSAPQVVLVISWIAWSALVANLGWNFLVVSGAKTSSFSSSYSGSFWHAGIVVAQALMILVIRWVFLRFMLRGAIRGSGQTVIRCLLGMLLLFGMVKVVEFEGFRLWIENRVFVQFLVFAVPSYILAAVLMPSRLLAYCAESFARQEHPAKGGGEQLT